MNNEQQKMWNDYRNANCNTEQTKLVLQVLKSIVQSRKPNRKLKTSKS